MEHMQHGSPGEGPDWDHVAETYGKLRAELGSIEILGEPEFEQYRLSCLTYGLIKAPDWEKISYGAAFYVAERGGRLAREVLIGIATEVGAPIGAGVELPEHVRRHIPVGELFRHIEFAIAQHQVTDEFLAAWGRLHSLHATYRVLSLSDEVSGAAVDQAINGMLASSVEIQQQWFAHWVRAHSGSLAPNARASPGQAMADACHAVGEGTLEPWGPYPKDWFTRVLNKDGTDLKDSFYKIGEDRLASMLAHPLVTREVLPPLSRSGFQLG